MNIQEFEAQLKADNFDNILTLEKPIGYALGEHTHPFEARALITQGSITLTVDGVSTTYGVGDVFSLPALTPHHEDAAAHGVTYRVGRKQQAST